MLQKIWHTPPVINLSLKNRDMILVLSRYKTRIMKVKDIILLADIPQWAFAYDINITPNYLSSIKNKKISELSRDLQLKIEYFLLINKETIEKRLKTLESQTMPMFRRNNIN